MQGFHPQKHKAAKPKNYVNGGIVTGPGTGTSDDVPAMVPQDGFVLPADSVQALGFKPGMRQAQLSAGEAVLNPQQVQAAGGFQALEAMKNATHTPVPEQGAEGQRFFFANGGPLDDEKRKPFMPTLQPDVQRDMTKMYSAGMPPRPQPAPSVGGAAAGGGRGFVSPQAEKTTPASSGLGFMPGTRAVLNESGKSIGDLAGQGRYGAALGEAARAATAYVPAVADDLVGGAVRAVVPGAMDAAKQFLGFGGEAKAVTPTAVSPAAKAPSATAAIPAVTPSGAPEQPGTPAAQANAQALGNVNVRRQPNGVLEFSGDNVAGDVSYGGPAGFKPRGAVSAQNMAAADSLAQRSAARGFTPRSQDPQPQPQGPQVAVMPSTGGYGLMDANRLRERELRMATTSTRSNLESSAGYKARMAGAAKALEGFQNEQTEGPRNAAERELKAQELAMRGQEMKDARGFRSGQLANDSARLGLEGQRVGAEVKTRNIEAGQAERMQRLQSEYLDAKTPEAQASAAKKIQALSGKTQQEEWKPVTLQGGTDAMGNKTEGIMGAVNSRTGEMRRYDGQPAENSAGQGAAVPPPEKRAVGATSTVNGKTAVWNGTKWVPQ